MEQRNQSSVSLAQGIASTISRKPGAAMQFKAAHGDCAKHGAYDTLVINGADVSCPQCLFEKQRQIDDQENIDRAKNNGLITFWNAGRMQHEVPARFVASTFETYVPKNNEQEKILTAIMGYAKSFESNSSADIMGERNMILSGRVGTGKTHLAISLARELAGKGFRAAYLTIFDLIRPANQNTFNGSQVIVDTLNSYDIVILDEIGAHPDFGFSAEMVASALFQLIDSRYLNCKATVIITNIDVLDLKKSKAGIGDRAMDRLGSAVVHKFFWESSRA